MTMKLEKFEDKSMSKRKVLLISLGVIMLISVSLLLYKNKNLKENDDVYFAFYNGNEKLESMPLKDNDEDLVFAHGECDNGASIEWNNNEWAPLVKNLSKSKTKCSLYFKKSFAKTVVKCGQEGKSATECIKDNMNLDESLINDDFDNLRYTGAEPNNYVDIGDVDEEGQPILWRIIGIVDNKLKIIRNENIGGMPWDSVDRTDILWNNSELKEYLNTTYKIDSTLITEELWNVGVADKIDYTAKEFYELERKSNWLGKVGLIGASDYGYAVGGDNRTSCLRYTLNNYNSDNCATNNWLKTKEDDRFYWTIVKEKWRFDYALLINEEGAVSSDYLLNGGGLYKVFPVVYLNENVRITSGSGTDSSPYHLEL